ncbi:MAG: NADH-quinone oxidoreductase subunit D [Planctomycetales bacterium]|nr:NADH-quinone oxidoreductase subunit D [Planctomycetales bacterium]
MSPELQSPPLAQPRAPGDVRTEEMLLNIGPQHPSTHGVFRVVVQTDGEIVLDSEPHIGYLHRCFEKIAESVDYLKVTPYTDRLDYLASMCNNLGYCLTVEKLMGLQIPRRATRLRMIVAELNRVASHLLAFGTYGMDSGAITPFLHAFRDREAILKLFEIICGQRLNYNYVRIGGLAEDAPPRWLDQVAAFVDFFEPKIDEYDALLSYNGIFIKRAANIGVLPAATAISWGCTGPVLRGSGVRRDIRKDEPYLEYDKVEFDVPIGRGEVGTLGDCWDRYMVRVREMREACKIVRQVLKDVPEGPVMAPEAKKVLRPPKGEVYYRIENPRGELGFYVVSDGKDKAVRIKCRSPAFCNLSVLREIAHGCMLADMIMIIGSIDFVMGEVDR